jgi:hypothetical protein
VGVDAGTDVVMAIVAELELLPPTVPVALAMSKQPIISGDEYFIAMLKRVWCKKTHDRGKISL